jgi:hypothetical protein
MKAVELGRLNELNENSFSCFVSMSTMHRYGEELDWLSNLHLIVCFVLYNGDNYQEFCELLS